MILRFEGRDPPAAIEELVVAAVIDNVCGDDDIGGCNGGEGAIKLLLFPTTRDVRNELLLLL